MWGHQVYYLPGTVWAALNMSMSLRASCVEDLKHSQQDKWTRIPFWDKYKSIAQRTSQTR